MQMWKIVDQLKDETLVIRFQEYFGIRYPPLSSSNDKENKLIVTNKFWYYLFWFGTFLGDEIFYASFIPIWFWNVDSCVGRRFVFLWAIVMYLGQSTKDIVRWNRPGPPVQKLQQKWAQEYGFPSTHAMVGLQIPLSITIYTLKRYIFPASVGLLVTGGWCALVSLSRLYLGMHSVLDVVAGLAFSALLMVPFVPLVDYLDPILLTWRLAPLFLITCSVLLIVFYPNSGKWTPTRGDTTLTISVAIGIYIGGWISYQTGDIRAPLQPPPYEIIWPTWQQLGLLLLRTVLGLCCIVATRAIAKSVSYAFVCFLIGRDKNELRNSADSLENKHKIFVELCYKYFTYGAIGFNTQFLLPHVFRLLSIGRPDFYTEI